MISRLINFVSCLLFVPFFFPLFFLWMALIVPVLYVFAGIPFGDLLFDSRYDPFAWFPRWLNRKKS